MAAKDTFTGNCILLKLKGKAVEIMGIRGISTVCPTAGPDKTIATMTLLRKFFIGSLLSLHKLGGVRFRNKIIGEPIFNFNECGGSPNGFNEFRNSSIYVPPLLDP